MKYSEYFKKADKEEKEKLKMSSEEIRHFFTTPLGELEPKYRNLIKDPGIISDSASIIEHYNRYSIEKIIDEYSNLDFDEDIDDYFYEPYFVYKDSDSEPCGYIVYTHVVNRRKYIDEIVLFSFDVNRKDFGRQIWTDFEKDLKSKLEDGYVIRWCSKTTNPAKIRYDSFMKEFNGNSKTIEDNIIEYVLGQKNV